MTQAFGQARCQVQGGGLGADHRAAEVVEELQVSDLRFSKGPGEWEAACLESAISAEAGLNFQHSSVLAGAAHQPG